LIRQLQAFVLAALLSCAVSAGKVCASDPPEVKVPILSTKEIVPGTIGTARTVFSGTEIDTFTVEILSVIHGIGPKQDLIVARAIGKRIEEVGVAQGMSGSPVFVDGKLVGAISTTWSLTKEPMMGITPVEQMVQEADLAERLRQSSAGRRASQRGASPTGDRPGSAAPIGSPLVLSQFDPRLIAHADSVFRPYGFTVTEGGALGKEEKGGAIEPGATLGVQLVGGDANMTAIGTVTWVSGDRVYGWGHPFLAIGDVEMPLVTGYIHAIVPSHAISFKLGAGGEVVGTISGDHRSGIFGKLGAPPPVTKLDLAVHRESVSDEKYHFDIVRDPSLLPLLVGLVSSNAFLVNGDAVSFETVSFTQRLVLDDGREATVKTLFAGDQTIAQISSLLSEATRVLMANPFEKVGVKQIDADLSFEAGVRLGSLTKITAEADTLEPGDELRGSYTLRDWRGEEHSHPFSFEIPKTARTGRYLLVVCDGQTAEMFEAERNPRAFGPRSLDELLERINRLRQTNEVHLLLYRATQGVLIDGRPLPDLPLSTLSVMKSAARSGIEDDLPAELVAEKRVPSNRLIQGGHTVRLEVQKENP
jgi:hypothetical protein